MRKLIASMFVSLDGVLQAPGAPEEDPTGGFAHGGWIVPFWDGTMDPGAAGFDGAGRDLVLGRRTYEIFEAYWPYQPADDPTARTLTAARKHVASRTLASVAWENAELLRGDAVDAVRALKATAGPDLQTIGSGELVHALQRAGLIDEFNVWTFPLVLGRGKRLFDADTLPATLRLVSSQVSGTGVVMSTYAVAGPVETGSFESAAPSAKELERRARMAAGNG